MFLFVWSLLGWFGLGWGWAGGWTGAGPGLAGAGLLGWAGLGVGLGLGSPLAVLPSPLGYCLCVSRAMDRCLSRMTPE